MFSALKIYIMKTILVPVDFSATAANAAEFSGNLAIFYNADLWFYHSYEPPVFVTGNTLSRGDSKQQIEMEHQMQAFKKEIQSKLRFSITIHTKIAMASLHEGLEGFCKETTPDIVVMGISGKSGLAKLVSGSNTLKVVHHLKYPVLVIPPKTVFMPVHKIGFACNYDKVLYSSSIDILEKVVKDFNAELCVIDVHSHYKKYNQEEILEGMFVNELLKKISPEYHTIDAEDITEELIHLPMKLILTGSRQYLKIITQAINYSSIAIPKTYCTTRMYLCCVCMDKFIYNN